MAWRRSGNKPLSGPMMVSLLTHICVTRPQSVNKQFESEVKVFLDQCDNGEVVSQNQTPLEMDIPNSNLTVQEVEAAIDYLKNN